MIDYGVLVYRGSFRSVRPRRSAVPSMLMSCWKRRCAWGFGFGREAVAIDPGEIISQTALATARRLGQKDEARQAWQAALASAKQLEPDARSAMFPTRSQTEEALNLSANRRGSSKRKIVIDATSATHGRESSSSRAYRQDSLQRSSQALVYY